MIGPDTRAQMTALFFKMLPFVGGLLIQYGVMTQPQLDMIITNLPAVIGFFATVWAVGYSLWANRKSKKIADVAAMKDVPQVTVSDPALAQKVISVNPNVKDTVVAP